MATRASAATVCEQFAATAAAHGPDVAIRTRDASVSWTWAQYAERARATAAALAALGVERHDSVALWLRNRPAFHALDAGAMLLGAVPVSIHTTAQDEQAAHVIADAGSRVLVTEPAFLGAALTIRNSLATDLEAIVLVDGSGPGAVSWDDFYAAADPGFDVDAASARVRPEDPICLVYTAGTTGPPKAIVLTHANVAAQIAAVTGMLGLVPSTRVVSFLPMAAMAERLCTQYLPMTLAWQVTCCPDPALVDVFLREVQPGFVFAPPRTWEQLQASVMARIDNAEGLRALDAALQRVHFLRDGTPVPEDLAAACKAADAAFFTPLRARLGLDRVSHALMGAAPCPVELTAFFHAIGIPVMELYGLSETAGPAAINVGPDARIGTVGVPLPGCELRLSERGEVLLRAPFVATHHRSGRETTTSNVDADGWFATGDLGALDADGALRIVDRVDALIVTGQGQTISPARIEAAIQRTSPLVGHACIIGDGRPYPVALLTLDGDGAREWARAHGLRRSDLGVLADHPELLGAVAAGVARANVALRDHEQVRRFLLLGADWPAGGDELTSTLKLKRSVISAKYAPEVEALYDGDGVEPAQL
ncbi:MAG: AMP-dependent synthetase and ligase [Solirubrobacterales bacterium]|nr:AMP-dependent synthetase and ligase [Solirubrobacterales bacterium]